MPSLIEVLFTPLGWALRNRRSGERHSVVSRPGWSGPETITVTSDSFQDAGTIDDRNSAIGRGQNLSPHLSWTGAPTATRQYIIVIEDLDFPFDRPGLHTIGLTPADVTETGEGELVPQHDRIRWVPIHDGTRTGYAGPRPLPGHGTHHYAFRLLALDHEIPASATIDNINQLDTHVSGHVLATGTLTGIQRG